MKREEVYQLIDGERDYQDQLPVARTDGHKKTVGEYVLTIEHYAELARKEWVNSAGTVEALKQVRKIAALCVWCMEEFDTEPRNKWSTPISGS